ncbi:RNA-directed DNA polymerase, eukaryota, reverse transcriptase zinc-binding domain protein [Tanacetum coccineum]
MKAVLESGPWMVNNVPLILNIWEPSIWLEKVEPSIIPIWVCVYNIPLKLCNGNGIGKIMSRVGKPMLMDKMTKERCLKKSRKLDFARVLVEVNAKEELPHVLEIAYPFISNRPAKVRKLEVKYQWRPPFCNNAVWPSFASCKVRPRTEDEVAASKLKEVLKVGGSVIDKGKLGILMNMVLLKLGKNMFKQKNSAGGDSNIYVQNSKNVKSNANIVVDVKKSSSHTVSGGIMKPGVDISNLNPKVLVRGSGSKSYVEDDLEGNVDEEYRNVVWPKLKVEVDEIMMSGTYPSMQVKTDWSLS